jgi:hypothetical protein
MHLQVTQNMHGVDTADQICGVYSCLTLLLKWWHHLLFYMLDTIVRNMWIIHSDLSFRFLMEPLTYMAFQLQLAKDLASMWRARKHGYSTFAPYWATVHGPKIKKRVLCKVCGEGTNQACLSCQICICKDSCYWDNHW